MSIYTVRQTKLFELMKENQWDCAIFGKPESIYYLTGISVMPFERYYGLTVDAVQKTISLVIPKLDIGCTKGCLEEISYLDSDGPREAIGKTIHGYRKIAVETDFFSIKTGKIFESLNVEIIEIGSLLSQIKMLKDATEIEIIQKAADIVDQAIEYVKYKIFVGMKEKELSSLLYQYMSSFEGFNQDEIVILVQGGSHTANPHGTSGEYAFCEGDIILMDFCAEYNHYWSDITRCVFLHKAENEKLKEIYEIVKMANSITREKVRPGMKAKDVDQIARDYITKAGYGKYFLHRTGHGLGLSVHEEPFITSTNELVLKENMVFTIEPGIYIEGVGGVRIEDDVVVTSDGCRSFTKTDRELVII